MRQRKFMERLILDTNVFIHDPYCIEKFPDKQIIIPCIVIEELDNLKNRDSGSGHAARLSIKILEEALKEIQDGIIVETGKKIQELPSGFSEKKADNQILGLALYYLNQDGNIKVITKDASLRVKCRILGISHDDYKTDSVDITSVSQGLEEISVPAKIIDDLYAGIAIKSDALSEILQDVEFYPNKFFLFNAFDANKRGIGRFDAQMNAIIPVKQNKVKDIWGIRPKNIEQIVALEMLLLDQIKCVSLIGQAGTGKTLLALAAALHKVTDEHSYKKVIVARPIIPMGKDIGYLPGDKDEKMKSWIQPITDNLEFLLHHSSHKKYDYKKYDKKNSDFDGIYPNEYQYLFDKRIVEVEALTYIRGRSIPQCYMIIDEAQNLTPREIKTIITRAGENTKIVLTGDPFQRDHLYLDEKTNGLSYCMEKFIDQEIASHIILTKCERSELAEIGAAIL